MKPLLMKYTLHSDTELGKERKQYSMKSMCWENRGQIKKFSNIRVYCDLPPDSLCWLTWQYLLYANSY